MVIRKTRKSRVQPKKRAASSTRPRKRSNRNPNHYRRNRGRTGYEGIWGEFIDDVEQALGATALLPANVSKAPYYSVPNVVKREVYRFVLHARAELNLNLLEDTIDASRVATANEQGKTLRTLKKDIKREPYFWVLMGLYLDCPMANLRKPDVTRFAQHLNYADRHDVPVEYLIGFLLQTGSLSDIYRRAQDSDRRETWFLEKANS